VRVIAVLPFQGAPEGSDLAPMVASEIPKQGDFRVVRPAEAVRTGEEALRLAARARADAVLAAAVTDYDAYDPPTVALSVQFLRVAGRSLPGADLDRLVRSPSWRRGPLEVSPAQAPHVIAAFEIVYDARDPDTRRALRRYAAETGQDEREIVQIQSRYLKFVASRLAKGLLGNPDVP
jgi:hypothetical protein